MTAPALPRLQLRWEVDATGESGWLCHYELVLPLHEYDIRRELYDDDGEQIGEQDSIAIAMRGPTKRNGSEPCVYPDGLYFDAPYRDGAHAKWDAAALGGLPIYVVALDGTYLQQEKTA